jgi:hypothetical protein
MAEVGVPARLLVVAALVGAGFALGSALAPNDPNRTVSPGVGARAAHVQMVSIQAPAEIAAVPALVVAKPHRAGHVTRSPVTKTSSTTAATPARAHSSGSPGPTSQQGTAPLSPGTTPKSAPQTQPRPNNDSLGGWHPLTQQSDSSTTGTEPSPP